MKGGEQFKRQPKKRILQEATDLNNKSKKSETVRPKRVKKSQITKKDAWIDDEFYEKTSDLSQYEIDSSDEIVFESKPLRATRVDILDLFNNSSKSDYKSLINISDIKWEKLVSSRPFIDYEDLVKFKI